jgi:hypothetical protein
LAEVDLHQIQGGGNERGGYRPSYEHHDLMRNSMVFTSVVWWMPTSFPPCANSREQVSGNGPMKVGRCDGPSASATEVGVTLRVVALPHCGYGRHPEWKIPFIAASSGT